MAIDYEFFERMKTVQKALCQRLKLPYREVLPSMKLGVSLNVKDGVQPVHGLRHPPQGDTCGWYVWAGEYSDDPDFFVPIHVEHLAEWRPEIIRYLSLPEGWRFLIADGHEDIWEDPELLKT